MGSYFYTAPEQFIDAKKVDHRADIFSLGRILYAMYSGTTPIAPDTSKLQPGTAFIINKCTQHDPARRFQNLTDLKVAWQSLFDPSHRDSEIGELKALCAESTAPASLSDDKVQRLLELFLKYQDDPDFIQERLMELDPAVVGAMFAKESDAVRSVLKVFTDLIANQGWPFDYTDKLANRCKALFEQIHDFEIRAEILGCLLEMGVDHNRWHVIGVFTELLELPKAPGEELAAKDKLASISEDKRKKAAGDLTLARLHRLLRPLFEFPK
jgi:serine/threonine protein kinase